MSYIPPSSPARGKENIAPTSPTPPEQKKGIPLAENILKSPSQSERYIPEKPVHIDQASLIRRWRFGHNLCSNEKEGLQHLRKSRDADFVVWTNENDPTNWYVAVSPTEVVRVSKGLADPIGVARAIAIRENRELLIEEQETQHAKEAMRSMTQLTFFLSYSSTTKELHLQLSDASLFTISCSERGYRLSTTREQATFGQFDQLLQSLGLTRKDSIYNCLYESFKKKYEQNPDEMVVSLKSANSFEQEVALDAISDVVQSKEVVEEIRSQLTHK